MLHGIRSGWYTVEGHDVADWYKSWPQLRDGDTLRRLLCGSLGEGDSEDAVVHGRLDFLLL